MELYKFLVENKSQIRNEATESLERAQLKSYKAASTEKNRSRIEKLLELTIVSVENKNLVGMTAYAVQIAKERFNAGFDLHEVHTAFNVLEETLWGKIIKNCASSELGEALGLVSTVLGAGKETLALSYVSLASKSKTRTLDLSELFGR